MEGKKKNTIYKKPKFITGEDVICRLNGEKAYIVYSFRASIVRLDTGKVKVIPEQSLKLLSPVTGKVIFDLWLEKDDKVKFLDIEKEEATGIIVNSAWFYIVHLYRTGELKVALAEILAKAGTKIISSIPGQAFSRDINVG